MCILYCCEGRKLDNYWVITPPSLNKEYCIVLYCIVLYNTEGYEFTTKGLDAMLGKPLIGVAKAL